MVEPWVILIILPLVVYFTRFIGVILSGYVKTDSQFLSTLTMLPIFAMISFFIPAALKGSFAEIAVLVIFVAVFWVSNNALFAMFIGISGLLAVKFLL